MVTCHTSALYLSEPSEQSASHLCCWHHPLQPDRLMASHHRGLWKRLDCRCERCLPCPLRCWMVSRPELQNARRCCFLRTSQTHHCLFCVCRRACDDASFEQSWPRAQRSYRPNFSACSMLADETEGHSLRFQLGLLAVPGRPLLRPRRLERILPRIPSLLSQIHRF